MNCQLWGSFWFCFGFCCCYCFWLVGRIFLVWGFCLFLYFLRLSTKALNFSMAIPNFYFCCFNEPHYFWIYSCERSYWMQPGLECQMVYNQKKSQPQSAPLISEEQLEHKGFYFLPNSYTVHATSFILANIKYKLIMIGEWLP